MPDSHVLMLVIGSNTKRRGGVGNYAPDLAITASLPTKHASLLVEGRSRVLRLILRGGVTRHKVRIADLPANRTLVNGPEFGGSRTDGLYLPAAERFSGRLYSQLERQGASLLPGARCHVLILTGLYGLVTPSESTQDHQCHVDDHPTFRKLWTQDDRLTEILLAYMRHFGITHVLDLTAQNSYRFLIAWERIRKEAEVVLHFFGEQTAGDELLVPLGALVRDWLCNATEEKLLSLRPGTSVETPYERVYLQPLPKPPTYAPQESERQGVELNVADELGRMRRCIIRLADATAEGLWEEDDVGVQGRITKLARQGRIPHVIADYMIHITRTRNKAEYSGTYRISAPTLQSVRGEFAAIREWAGTSKLPIPDECLEL
jgi:hypothetical protein